MIKITSLDSDKKTNRHIIFIPGGPGLSSLTLRTMDILKRSFHLHYIDFPGTNGNPYLKDSTYEELVDELISALKEKFKDKKDELIVAGHSFGGFFAADLAIKMKLKGLVCIAVPFSGDSLQAVEVCYDKKRNGDLLKSEEEWIKKQDDESLAKWFSHYGELYFLNPSGKELILKDPVSAKFFIANREDASRGEDLLLDLEDVKCPKLFILGESDGLLPSDILVEDARAGGFALFEIENASHFVTFDQPERVASLLEKYLS